ncbi:hypothetical protein HYH03_003026 [Edaphochlamys debaryana]|uniref:Uncharacterized protein n=1 Tax=Edaphochlamys debaryana TaxID=47281 RepID=A0A835YCN7_9CHLO|nr:hypothetical protein HYH03_003026 [Edaphochlamys debaryana]|eukprot:KAG2498833.1 hypothetical protein HYH03_003026 [Edaphochlamys debaryana]
MMLRPSSVAAYGLPGAFPDYGASSLTAAACPAALLPPTAASPRANMTTWAMGWAGVGGCDAASGPGSRWWCEVSTGAKINLLAARAWRRGGMDGVQAALEALRAAHCGGDKILRRRREAERAATASQLMVIGGLDPNPEELRKAAREALLQDPAMAAPADWLATALAGMAGAADQGAAVVPWAVHGDWALRFPWERPPSQPRRDGVTPVPEGTSPDVPAGPVDIPLTPETTSAASWVRGLETFTNAGLAFALVMGSAGLLRQYKSPADVVDWLAGLATSGAGSRGRCS